MRNIRLLPVVVCAIAALLVLKTLGLATNGGYMLLGVNSARAAGGGEGGEAAAPANADSTIDLPASPTLDDTSPTLADTAPTLGGDPAAADAGGGHGAAPAEGEAAAAAPAEGAAPAAAPTAAEAHTAPAAVGAAASSVYCVEPNATITDSGEVVMNQAAADASGEGHGSTPSTGEATDGHGATAEQSEGTADAANFAATVIDCLPSGDAVAMEIGADGKAVPVGSTDAASGTDAQLLERLAARRAELQQYEQDLTLRASLVDAAEKRIEERTATLQQLEQQISALVDQRQQLATDQFAGIVAMYETMKPKDAATIFNSLDMNVLLQVAKTMSPRKMAPILAAMDPARAQELTVKMADLQDQPAGQMTPADLAALPQIVGQ